MLGAIIYRVQETNSYPDLSAINIIYGASETGAGVRRLLADFYVYGASQAWLDTFEHAEEKSDQEYIDEVLVALATRARGLRNMPWVENPEAYIEDGAVYDSTSSGTSGVANGDKGIDQGQTSAAPCSTLELPVSGFTFTLADRTRA